MKRESGVAAINDTGSRREPVFNVPAVVTASVAVLAGVHAVRALLPPAADNWFVEAMAFIPARYSGQMTELPGGVYSAIGSFVTHLLIHADIAHLGLNSAWLLVFGSAIAARVGPMWFLLFAGFCGILGAATFLALNWGLLAPVVGASGAIAGLMGGTMRFMFSALDTGELWRLREAPQTVRLMSMGETLRNKRVLIASGLFVVTNLGALIGFGGAKPGQPIAWEAHIGGFAAGLLAFGLFDRRSAAIDQE